MDEEVFEVYGGCCNKDKAPNKRWEDVGDKDATVLAFVKSLTFEEISKLSEKGFVGSLDDDQYDEEVEEEVIEEDDGEDSDFEHEGDKDDENSEVKNKGQPKT